MGGGTRQSGAGERPLHIPDEALTAAGAAFLAALERATETTSSKDPRHAYPDEVIAAAVEAAAPLIVAAELRRLSYEIAVFTSGYHSLRQRADQLDVAGGGGPR